MICERETFAKMLVELWASFYDFCASLSKEHARKIVVFGSATLCHITPKAEILGRKVFFSSLDDGGFSQCFLSFSNGNQYCSRNFR